MKQKLIIGNWKMHGTFAQARLYLDVLLPKLPNKENVQVMLSVPFTLLSTMSEKTKNSFLKIGAQNLSEELEGAFTGEVSSRMIQEAGASFVLIGHSERRRLFHETGPQIRRKIEQALSAGIQPIVCVGETAQERQEGREKDVLRKQLQEALDGLSLENIIVAYEPVWAIGTGQNASPEIAEEIHCFCRGILKEIFGAGSDQVPIVYGGSVKDSNVAGFLSQSNVDGVLVGGASLDPESFLRIIQSS